MSEGEDDVHICDTCMDIFLTSEELQQHENEAHKASKEDAVAVEKNSHKRSRSNSSEGKENVPKKPKMGPASRVKRDRSSSPESSVKKNGSKSPNGDVISSRLASTDSEAGSRKGEKSDRDHKKHKKHKDRDRSRDRDRDREKHHGDKHKKKHKDGDRERSKEKERNGEWKDKWKMKIDFKEKDRSHKYRSMDDFIDDDEPMKKKSHDKPRYDDRPSARLDWRDDKPHKDSPTKITGLKTVDETKKVSGVAGSGGFASQGTVKAHDNEGGPECFKCGQVCKDNANLKNHVLSHYYQVFYDVLPDSKPYECTICDKPNRDRITLVRHFAFSHNKFFEMTDVTADDLGGMGKRGGQGPRPPKPKPVSSETKEKVKDILNNLKDDKSEDEDIDIEEKIKRMNSIYLKVNDGTNKDGDNADGDGHHKDHKKHKKHKHKHKDHKEHKHKKEKKHKKDKHHDREKDESSANSKPLNSLLKEMSPVSSESQESQDAKPHTPPGSPPGYKSPARDEHEGQSGANNAEDSDEDLLGDLDIAPTFA